MTAARRKCRACGLTKAATAYWKGRTFCKECCRPEAVAARKAQAARKKRAYQSSRTSRIKRTYGLTPEDEAAILRQQGGVCPGCLRRPRDIDHCHTTGEVRGKLCGSCNRRILPAARNDPDVLRRLADYLENPPARAVGPFYVPEAA